MRPVPDRPTPPAPPRPVNRRPRSNRLAGATLALGLGALVFLGAACSSGDGGLEATDPAATPAVAGGDAAVYLTLENHGDERRLVGVTVESAAAASIHRTEIDPSGLTAMAPVDAVALPSGERVVFEPGGLHVMAEGLERDWEPGQTIAVELTFDDGDDLDLDVPVKDHADIGEGGHADGDDHGH